MSDDKMAWGTWQDNELAFLDVAVNTTPDQRLEWLEEANDFAWRSGALERSQRWRETPSTD